VVYGSSGDESEFTTSGDNKVVLAVTAVISNKYGRP
jgi:hypothetical protein